MRFQIWSHLNIKTKMILHNWKVNYSHNIQMNCHIYQLPTHMSHLNPVIIVYILTNTYTNHSRWSHLTTPYNLHPWTNLLSNIIRLLNINYAKFSELPRVKAFFNDRVFWFLHSVLLKVNLLRGLSPTTDDEASLSVLFALERISMKCNVNFQI